MAFSRLLEKEGKGSAPYPQSVLRRPASLWARTINVRCCAAGFKVFLFTIRGAPAFAAVFIAP
jgi:hypothetical protein